MIQPEPASGKPGPKARPPLEESDIHGLKYFKVIGRLLESLHSHQDGPNRKIGGRVPKVVENGLRKGRRFPILKPSDMVT